MYCLNHLIRPWKCNKAFFSAALRFFAFFLQLLHSFYMNYFTMKRGSFENLEPRITVSSQNTKNEMRDQKHNFEHQFTYQGHFFWSLTATGFFSESLNPHLKISVRIKDKKQGSQSAAGHINSKQETSERSFQDEFSGVRGGGDENASAGWRRRLGWRPPAQYAA